MPKGSSPFRNPNVFFHSYDLLATTMWAAATKVDKVTRHAEVKNSGVDPNPNLRGGSWNPVFSPAYCAVKPLHLEIVNLAGDPTRICSW